jgi:hypothetical protein
MVAMRQDFTRAFLSVEMTDSTQFVAMTVLSCEGRGEAVVVSGGPEARDGVLRPR